MRLRLRRKPHREKEPPRAPRNPYVAARTNFESLFRNQAKEKHAWKLAALAELLIVTILVAAYVQLASTSRVVPYVVEVDGLGQAVAFGPAEPLQRNDRRVIVRPIRPDPKSPLRER